MDSYNAKEVNSILEESTGMIQALLGENVKQAELLDQQQVLIETLRKESTEQAQERIRLQKVANANPVLAVPEESVRMYIDKLASSGFLKKDADSLVESLREDPSRLLKLANRVLDLTTPAPNTGSGVQPNIVDGNYAKVASSRKERELEEDGWNDALNS
jgi:hypothetical protein